MLFTNWVNSASLLEKCDSLIDSQNTTSNTSLSQRTLEQEAFKVKGKAAHQSVALSSQDWVSISTILKEIRIGLEAFFSVNKEVIVPCRYSE